MRHQNWFFDDNWNISEWIKDCWELNFEREFLLIKTHWKLLGITFWINSEKNLTHLNNSIEILKK